MNERPSQRWCRARVRRRDPLRAYLGPWRPAPPHAEPPGQSPPSAEATHRVSEPVPACDLLTEEEFQGLRAVANALWERVRLAEHHGLRVSTAAGIDANGAVCGCGAGPHPNTPGRCARGHHRPLV